MYYNFSSDFLTFVILLYILIKSYVMQSRFPTMPWKKLDSLGKSIHVTCLKILFVNASLLS